MRRRIGRLAPATAAAVFALAAGLLAPLPQAAAVATAAPTATAADGDLCQGRCADILPPGQNGNATLADILVHKVLGTRPAHSSDQLGRYDSLVGGYGGLTDAKLNDFFNDSSFGVPDGQAESVTTPRPDVTITRDKKTGVPHIKGTTRYGTEFGAGFAAGQDRLWMMDLFRHIGRGELTPFMRRRARQPGPGAAVLALCPLHRGRLPGSDRPDPGHRGRPRRAGHGRCPGVCRRHQRLSRAVEERALLPR